MTKLMHDDETGEVVEVAPEDVHPIVLVVGEFVEVDEGVFVRAAAVTRILAMEPIKDASTPKVYLCNVITGSAGEGDSNWSVYPVRTVLAALNLALENGRQRRVEREDY